MGHVQTGDLSVPRTPPVVAMRASSTVSVAPLSKGSSWVVQDRVKDSPLGGSWEGETTETKGGDAFFKPPELHRIRKEERGGPAVFSFLWVLPSWEGEVS